MFSNEETLNALVKLGVRLKEARISKGDSQAIFAGRLGVSIPTLREMEQGKASVAIGTWMAALWMLSRLGDCDAILSEQASLFAQYERSGKSRQRVPRAR